MRRTGIKAPLTALLLCAGVYILTSMKYTRKTVHASSDTKRRQKVLIVLTQTRSGSSFTGEVFASANDSMYLYEPLYPFGQNCASFVEQKQRLLKQILNCDFSKLRTTYEYGFNKSHQKDYASCRKEGFCFTRQSIGLANSYLKVCSHLEPEYIDCGYPMQYGLLNKVCDNSSLIVTKITRICSLEDLGDIYQHLTAAKKDTYILHLVRDLRSIASSRIKLNDNLDLEGIGGYVTNSYCRRQRRNLEYLKSVSERTKESSIIADGRYMRLRYEDMATNAVDEAKGVFKFLKLPFPPEVDEYVRSSLHPNITHLKQIVATGGKGIHEAKKILKKLDNPYGKVRDPLKIVNEWRNIVPFELVKRIQDECGDVIEKMGYTLFPSQEKMKDFSLHSFAHK